MEESRHFGGIIRVVYTLLCQNDWIPRTSILNLCWCGRESTFWCHHEWKQSNVGLPILVRSNIRQVATYIIRPLSYMEYSYWYGSIPSQFPARGLYDCDKASYFDHGKRSGHLSWYFILPNTFIVQLNYSSSIFANILIDLHQIMIHVFRFEIIPFCNLKIWRPCSDKWCFFRSLVSAIFELLLQRPCQQ